MQLKVATYSYNIKRGIWQERVKMKKLCGWDVLSVSRRTRTTHPPSPHAIAATHLASPAHPRGGEGLTYTYTHLCMIYNT